MKGLPRARLHLRCRLRRGSLQGLRPLPPCQSVAVRGWLAKAKKNPARPDFLKTGGASGKICECSLDLRAFAEIAEWLHVAIQRNFPSENDFEDDSQVGIPLKCKLPPSKSTMRNIRKVDL